MSKSTIGIYLEYEPAITLKSLIFNILSFTAVVAAAVLLKLLNVPVYQRGFFCEDDSIRHPYKEDSVKYWELFVFTMGPSVIIIVVSEFRRFLMRRRRDKAAQLVQLVPSLDSGSQVQKRPNLWRTWMIRTVMQLTVLIYGLAMTMLVVEMLKHSMGRLRPYFLDVCQLERDSYDCSDGRGYVREFLCNQMDTTKLEMARQSFVSGYAAIAFYFMMFASTYVAIRTPKMYAFPKALIQVCQLGVAAYIGATRITDHANHPQDVIAGSLLGAFLGYISAKRMSTMVGFKNLDDSKSHIFTDVKSAVTRSTEMNMN